MKSSSKGASDKRRLTQYVANTVLDDNYKGTAEQFVLHFNEQFRQLEEISEESEHFPQDLEPPTDDILEFITSQEHSDDLLDQVLQTYQAYQLSQSEIDMPPRQMNAHITYHVAQAKQAKHGSLVDRGANGGLAGSDVRVLSTSSRKCTVTVMKYQDWT